MGIRIKYILLFGIIFFFQNTVLSQEDSTAVDIEYITEDAPIKVVDIAGVSVQKEILNKVPSTAALYSAVLPGLGQLYNERYWKLPLVYAAIGGGIYATIWNQQNYQVFLEAYRIRHNGGQDDYYNILSTEKQLISWMDYYRNQRDLSILVTIGIYAFNILDAYVDAHLINFNINDDLTLKVEPSAVPNPLASSYFSYGLKFKLEL